MTGKITQIIGPVVDVRFDADSLPAIYNKLSVDTDSGAVTSLEVMLHTGDNIARCQNNHNR